MAIELRVCRDGCDTCNFETSDRRYRFCPRCRTTLKSIRRGRVGGGAFADIDVSYQGIRKAFR